MKIKNINYRIFFYLTKAIKGYLSYSLIMVCSSVEMEKDATYDKFIAAQLFTPRIPTKIESFHGVLGLAVQPFPEEEKTRNHYGPRPDGASIRYLVMHYTECVYDIAIKWFTLNTDKFVGNASVSSHYIITEDEENVSSGIPVRVVPDEFRARHTGDSQWGVVSSLNDTSIGIEHVNKGFVKNNNEKIWVPFDEDQIRTSGLLSQGIIRQYNISPKNVVAHADIAPNRKSDPGPLFPWGRLHYEFGVGAWLTEDEREGVFADSTIIPREPLPLGISDSFMLSYLADYGYPVAPAQGLSPDNKNALIAFQSHFSKNQLPHLCTSKISLEDQMWIYGLVNKYP